ncbi:MAG: hypothetical protein ABL891_15040 [Burkholderiales bacterium]
MLTKSRRRCALCFCYDSVTSIVDGQIAHIDRNKNNNLEDNLAFLCLPHHNKYDSTSRQSKGFLAEELIQAKLDLEKWAEKLEPGETGATFLEQKDIPVIRKKVSIEVFERRLPIYRAFHRFVGLVLTESKISYSQIFDFGNETHEALFLFDEKIERYLNEIYEKAVNLRSVRKRMEQPSAESSKNWENWVQLETDGLLWFSEQLRNGKKIFYPYLKI